MLTNTQCSSIAPYFSIHFCFCVNRLLLGRIVTLFAMGAANRSSISGNMFCYVTVMYAYVTFSCYIFQLAIINAILILPLRLEVGKGWSCMLLSHPHITSACMQPCNIMKLLYYWPCSNGTSMPCMLHDVFHASWVIPSSDRSFDFFLISNLAAPSEYYALHTSSIIVSPYTMQCMYGSILLWL